MFDLGGLGYGEKFSQVQWIKQVLRFQPEMIKRALEKVNDNDYVVWLDADTILWDNQMVLKTTTT